MSPLAWYQPVLTFRSVVCRLGSGTVINNSQNTACPSNPEACQLPVIAMITKIRCNVVGGCGSYDLFFTITLLGLRGHA